MHYFFTLLSLVISFTASAKIYTWQDAQGVTHFSEKKPDHQVEIIHPSTLPKITKSEEMNALSATMPLTFSGDFMLGTWTGFSDSSQSTQEWVFKEQGLFTIKQSAMSNIDLVYTGQWELAEQAILLNGKLFDEGGMTVNNTDFDPSNKQAKILDNDNNRLLVGFNDEKFWLERH